MTKDIHKTSEKPLKKASFTASSMAQKRQKRYALHYDDNTDVIPMQRVSLPKFENTIEAQVQDGDTLQALALRFHCSVADIKRLNKIDKDNEIYARKVVKIPVTVHSVLLDTLPIVHKSGNNSPNHRQGNEATSSRKDFLEADILGEKLLVASVNSGGQHINNSILQSKVRSDTYTDVPTADSSFPTNDQEPLLSGILDESIPQPRPIPGPAVRPWDWSGSDCDISWACLLIVILALCIAIPVVIIYLARDHPKAFHHNGF